MSASTESRDDNITAHCLRLKVRFAESECRRRVLCNGTRLICHTFARHVIDAQIVSGTCSGRHVFIPCIQLTSPDSIQFCRLRWLEQDEQLRMKFVYCWVFVNDDCVSALPVLFSRTQGSRTRTRTCKLVLEDPRGSSSSRTFLIISSTNTTSVIIIWCIIVEISS